MRIEANDSNPVRSSYPGGLDATCLGDGTTFGPVAGPLDPSPTVPGRSRFGGNEIHRRRPSSTSARCR